MALTNAALISASAASAYAAFVWWRLRLLHAAIAEGRSMGPGWLQQLSARLMLLGQDL